MDKLKSLFESKMYLIGLLPFLFMIRFSEIETYGINKTVGWIWDISGFSIFIRYFLIGFWLTFCFLALLKAKTNFLLSILFFFVISFCTLFMDVHRNILLTDKLLFASIILFVMIFVNSVYTKIKSLKK